jgi:hypothetical protein
VCGRGEEMNSTKWVELVEAARTFFLAENPASKREKVIDALKRAGGAIVAKIENKSGWVSLGSDGRIEYGGEKPESKPNKKFSVLFLEYKKIQKDYLRKQETFRSLIYDLDSRELAEIVISANEGI